MLFTLGLKQCLVLKNIATFGFNPSKFSLLCDFRQGQNCLLLVSDVISLLKKAEVANNNLWCLCIFIIDISNSEERLQSDEHDIFFD
jgi:hypothetical protein